KEEFFPEDCNLKKCSLDIPISSEGSVYCVSAKGSFYNDLILGAPSEESCIPIPLKLTLSSTNVVIVIGVILIFGLFLIVFYGYKKLRKKNIKLPKSLVSVIRNLNTSRFLEPKPETKCNSVISLMPDEPPTPADEEVHPLKVEQKEGIANPENSSEGASSVLLPEVQGNSGELSVHESTGEVSSDDEQNHKGRESYFPSDNNQTEIRSNCSDAEVSTTVVQQTIHPSSTLKFSGYDKPHVPLNMLIDVGEERPVVAYRPTE
ncbi:INGR1 protein, partial [Crypturellus undulatus]|nr:INGR1 protein [Crypturellus undulatus]